MDVFRLQYEEMSDYPAHLFPRQLVNLSTRQPAKPCQLFSKNFNTMSALFATNRQPCRKKSILAKVRFGAKGDGCTCRQNEFLFKLTATNTHFFAICSKMKCILVLNAVRFGAKCNAFWC